MENEQTRYEQLKKEILKCIDKDYVMPKNIPLPFERSVLYKQLDQIEVKSTGGLILGSDAAMGASNVLRPNIGIVVAVGPKVPDYIIPRLMAYFNQNNDLEYFIGGAYYKMCDYSDLHAAIPEGTLTSIDLKDDKEQLREKRMDESASFEARMKIKGDEEKDVLDFLKKGKRNTIN